MMLETRAGSIKNGLMQKQGLNMLKQKDNRLKPAQEYHTYLTKRSDDAYWDGDTERGAALQKEAKYVKENYIDRGEVWVPNF